MDLWVAAPTIAQAEFARCMSEIKEQRVAASALLPGVEATFEGDRKALVNDIRDAYAEDAPVNLVLAPYFPDALTASRPGHRRVAMEVPRLGIASPAFNSAIDFISHVRLHAAARGS